MPAIRKWAKVKSPDEPTVAVAIRALKNRLRAVDEFLQLAARRAREDQEYVHQLRVSTRRAGAALRLFHEFVGEPHARRLRKPLRLIRRAAGEARDLDVLSARLKNGESADQLQPLLRRLIAARDQAQRPIRRAYRKWGKTKRLRKRARRLVRDLKALAVETAGSVPPFCSWATRRLEEAVSEFLQAGRGDLSHVDELHRFRIQGKRLRYTVELVAAAFPREFRTEAYTLVEQLQERLGTVNDHAAAFRRFEAWLPHAETDEERRVLTRLVEHESQAAQAAEEQFRQWWTAQRSLYESRLTRTIGTIRGYAAPSRAAGDVS